MIFGVVVSDTGGGEELARFRGGSERKPCDEAQSFERAAIAFEHEPQTDELCKGDMAPWLDIRVPGSHV